MEYELTFARFLIQRLRFFFAEPQEQNAQIQVSCNEGLDHPTACWAMVLFSLIEGGYCGELLILNQRPVQLLLHAASYTKWPPLLCNASNSAKEATG